MDTNNEATSTYLDEDTPILPDGWADGDDLFTDSDDAAEVDTAAEPGATDTGVAENAADTDGRERMQRRTPRQTPRRPIPRSRVRVRRRRRCSGLRPLWITRTLTWS